MRAMRPATHAGFGIDRTICGAIGADAYPRASDSEAIDCKKCRKALAAAMPQISQFSSDSLWQTLRLAEQAAAIAADYRVGSARKHLVDQIESAERLLRSALEDVARTKARIAKPDSGLGGYDMLDMAMGVGRVSGYVASNLRVDMLARYGMDLDNAIAAALRAAKLDGQEG